jgi:hypothetical protein
MARCVDPVHLKKARQLTLKYFDGAFLLALLESSSKGQPSQNLDTNEIMALMKIHPPELVEDVILNACKPQPYSYPYLFPVAINRGFVRFAKTLYDYFMKLHPNGSVLDTLVLPNIDYLDDNCLHRLFKQVGVPFIPELFEVIAGYPSIKRPTKLDQALIQFCRQHDSGKVVTSAGLSEQALSAFIYILENIENVSVPPTALPLAVLSRNRELIEILWDKREFSVTAEALHTAFFIRDYSLLEYLLEKLEKDSAMCNSISSETPLTLPPLNEQLSRRMPFPVTPSDTAFFEMLFKLVAFGVYDYGKWRKQVINDALCLHAFIIPGVITNLIRFGKAEVTAAAVSRSSKLTDIEEFKFLLDQPIDKSQLETLQYQWIHSVDRAKCLRSLGVPVTLRSVQMFGPASTSYLSYTTTAQRMSMLETFTQLISWYIEDKMALSSQLSEPHAFDENDKVEDAVLYNFLFSFVLFSDMLPDTEVVPYGVFEQLVNLGFPVTQECVTKAEEQGWTLLADLFRRKLS